MCGSKLLLWENLVAERKKVSDKEKAAELKTFVENVNKKDKVSGLKIHFAFVNRKRRG